MGTYAREHTCNMIYELMSAEGDRLGGARAIISTMAKPREADLPTNGEIADRLELLGDLLEIEGDAVRHRVLAYRRGAVRVRSASRSVAEMALAGRAVELPDIGATLQAKIVELATTGDIAALARLRERVPEGLATVARIDGIGPRRARALWSERGVRDLDDLRAVATEGRLKDVSGFGPRSAERVVAQLESGAGPPERTRMSLGRATEIAEALAADLAAVPGVSRVEVAGSVRRGLPDIGDIDLVAAAADAALVGPALAEHPMTRAALAQGPASAAVETHAGIRVELKAGPPESFGNLLQHATGSAAHNIRLREIAVRRGMSMSELGIQMADGTLHRSPTEEDVYGTLDLPWIPPELREDTGEIAVAAAGALPTLVTEEDLRGELHMHTDWSDGRATLDQMVAAAGGLGLEYVAVSDHSKSLAMAGGLDEERVRRQWERIDELNARGEGPQILRACEVDILADGVLDFDDDFLAEFDWVTASLHSGLSQGSERITARLLAAIESPHVDAIGHPTGRMLGRRTGSRFDVERVLDRAAATGTCLEINSQPRRLDLPDHLARQAIAAGVMLVIGSDAHSPAELAFRRFGVTVARRAGARAADIANTRPFAELVALRSAQAAG